MKNWAPCEVIDANKVDIVGPRLGQLVLGALKMLHVLQTEIKFCRSWSFFGKIRSTLYTGRSWSCQVFGLLSMTLSRPVLSPCSLCCGTWQVDNFLNSPKFLNSPDLWLPDIFILGHPVLVLHLLQTPELQSAVEPAREIDLFIIDDI